MADDAPNPYAPPQMATEASPLGRPLSHEQVRRRLLVPAIGILVAVAVNFAWLVSSTVWFVRVALESGHWNFHELMWYTVAILVTGLVNYSAAVGAVAMLQLQDYRAAMRGAWFAFVPCGIGCFVALPFAAYADWLLRDPRVHAAFSHQRIRLFPQRRKGR